MVSSATYSLSTSRLSPKYSLFTGAERLQAPVAGSRGMGPDAGARLVRAARAGERVGEIVGVDHGSDA
jgi:hypothetical protein